MKIVFKSDDYDGLSFTREYADGFGVAAPSGIHETVREVAYKGIRSRGHKIYCPGMICGFFEGTWDRDVAHLLDSDFPYLQMHFELTSTGCLYQPLAKHEVATTIYKGAHSVLFYPSLQGRLSYLKASDAFSVEIELSLDFIRRLFHDDLEMLEDFGRKIEANQPAVMGNRSYPITPGMQRILQEIRTCPYAGMMKRLFVENKVSELLLLQIAQITALSSDPGPLKKRDEDKLHEVRDLLVSNRHQPLSIAELSRLAGINRTKLQSGFRKVFGTTVFGYLSELRLEEARQQIEAGDFTSLAEVAHQCGYKNPQHFTAAFKRKFGILPRDLKEGKRRL